MFKQNPVNWSSFRFLPLVTSGKTKVVFHGMRTKIFFFGKLNSLVDLEETPGMLRVEFNLNLLVIPVDINVSILCLPPTPL